MTQQKQQAVVAGATGGSIAVLLLEILRAVLPLLQNYNW